MEWSQPYVFAPQRSVWAWGLIIPYPERVTKQMLLLTREGTVKERIMFHHLPARPA